MPTNEHFWKIGLNSGKFSFPHWTLSEQKVVKMFDFLIDCVNIVFIVIFFSPLNDGFIWYDVQSYSCIYSLSFFFRWFLKLLKVPKFCINPKEVFSFFEPKKCQNWSSNITLQDFPRKPLLSSKKLVDLWNKIFF